MDWNYELARRIRAEGKKEKDTQQFVGYLVGISPYKVASLDGNFQIVCTSELDLTPYYVEFQGSKLYLKRDDYAIGEKVLAVGRTTGAVLVGRVV